VQLEVTLSHAKCIEISFIMIVFMSSHDNYKNILPVYIQILKFKLVFCFLVVSVVFALFQNKL